MIKLGLINLSKSSNLPPPIGLLSIATYLKKNPAIDIKILDRNFSDVFKEINNANLDLVGISAMTVEYGMATELASQIKETLSIPVIIGGVHVTTLPQSLSPLFDLGIIGEGEATMEEVINSFLKNNRLIISELKKIKSLIIYENNKLILTGKRERLNLDNLPLLDWHLIDKRYFQKRRFDEMGEFGIGASILTSRGCPYKCSFCSTTIFWGNRVRFYSLAKVIEEIKQLVNNFEVNLITIWDDIFTINKKRLKEFVGELNKLGLLGKIKFSCLSRANVFDEEICTILKQLGVKSIFFGFESGSDKTLHFLKGSGVTVKDNYNAILLGTKYKFNIQGAVIFGTPGEKLEDMNKTIDFIGFAVQRGVYKIFYFILTPFPATKIWEIALKRGVVSNSMDWNLLSHQNFNEPFLLDNQIEIKDFLALFKSFRFKKYLLIFKFRIIKSYMKNSFYDLFRYTIKRYFKL